MKRIFYCALASTLALGFGACEPHKASELPQEPYGERMGNTHEKPEGAKAEGEKPEKEEKSGATNAGDAKPAEGGEKK